MSIPATNRQILTLSFFLFGANAILAVRGGRQD